MKNSKFSKICLWTLTLALLLTAFVGISAQADETPEAPIIESKNVSYEGALHLYYAIPVTENVKAANTVVNVYKTNPDTDASAELIGTFSGSERYIEVLGGNYIEIRTQGISAKNIADYVYAEPVSGGVAGKVVRYSVAEYLYERLYVSENSDDLQKTLYKSTLQYGIDAQAVLAPTATPIASYNYVYAKDATIDTEGNNSGLYLEGETLTLTYTGNANFESWNFKRLDENSSFVDSSTTSNFLDVTANKITIVSPQTGEAVTPPPAYTFDSTTLPDGVKPSILGSSSAIEVKDGKLNLTSMSGYTDSIVFFETEEAEENANTVVWSAEIRSETLTAAGSGERSQFSFRDNNNTDFKFNIMFRTSSTTYFKNYSHYPQKIELTDTGVKSGDTYNIRIEYYVDEETSYGTVDIYINDNFIGTICDSNVGCPAVDDVTKFTFRCREADHQFITFDNVRLYKINKDR